MTTILMIDDDVALLRLTEINLTRAGYRFVSAQNGITGLQAIEREKPSLVVLDLRMPKLDGWETCRLIREISDLPIIMLTARDDETDKARGLDLGADDYLTKPFGFVELEARIRAALRRAEMPAVAPRSHERIVYHAAGLVLDVAAHAVSRDGEPIALTPIEFRLLQHLFENAGRVLSPGQLLTAVWGHAYADATELLKPTVSRLRRKIEEDPAVPCLIHTVHGFGYRLEVPPLRSADEPNESPSRSAPGPAPPSAGSAAS